MEPRALLRAVVSAAAAGLLGACASLPDPLPERPLVPEAAALVARADLLLQQDRPEEARALLREAASLEPRGAGVLRLEQAAAMALGDDHGVRLRAESALAADPADPLAAYLLARTEDDAGAAEDLLERAVRGDPSLAWAWLGLAQAAQRRGDLDGADARLDAAERCSPGHPWVPLLRASLALERKEVAAALPLLEDAVARDPGGVRARVALGTLLLRIPGEEGRARPLLREALARAPGDRGLAERCRRALEDAPPEEARAFAGVVSAAEIAGEVLTPQARHLRGAARLAVGDAEGAVADLRAAVEAGEDRTPALDDLRLALFLAGRWGEAAAAERAATPPGILDDPGSDDPGRFAEFEAAAATAPDDPEGLGRLARACTALGRLREASVVAARRAALVPGDAAARDAAAAAAAALDFVEAFREAWKGAYHGASAGGPDGDLDGAVALLRELSLRHLGVDLSEGLAHRSFGLLGEAAESVRATGPCGAWFRAHGLALLLGKGAGRPAEARLLRVVSVRTDREEESLGRRFRCTTVVGEGLLVPSYHESRGGVLGGAAVGDLVFLDLEGVGRWAGAASRAARDPALRERLAAVAPAPAADAAEETSLRFPGLLSERLSLREPRWADPREALADFLDAARRHEHAHAADAADYLPAWRHPLAVLGLLWRGGFSAAGVQAVLEGDAEVVALATARRPRAALATMASYLPSREGGLAHAAGYHDAMAEVVAVLRERGHGRPGWNLLRELDALDPEILRAAALEVCRRRGRTAE